MQQDHSKLQFILFYKPGQTASEEAVRLVPDHTRIEVQDVTQIPTTSRPAWLKGVPLLMHVPEEMIFLGSDAIKELRRYVDFLNKHFMLTYQGNPMTMASQARALLQFGRQPQAPVQNVQPQPEPLGNERPTMPETPRQSEVPLSIREQKRRAAFEIQDLPPPNLGSSQVLNTEPLKLPPMPKTAADLEAERVAEAQQLASAQPANPVVFPETPQMVQQRLGHPAGLFRGGVEEFGGT